MSFVEGNPAIMSHPSRPRLPHLVPTIADSHKADKEYGRRNFSPVPKWINHTSIDVAATLKGGLDCDRPGNVSASRHKRVCPCVIRRLPASSLDVNLDNAGALRLLEDPLRDHRFKLRCL